MADAWHFPALEETLQTVLERIEGKIDSLTRKIDMLDSNITISMRVTTAVLALHNRMMQTNTGESNAGHEELRKRYNHYCLVTVKPAENARQ